MWSALRLILGIAVLGAIVAIAAVQRRHPRPHDKAAALRHMSGWVIRDRPGRGKEE